MNSIPGDPFVHTENLPKEVLESLYEHYGLNKPLWIQYLKYVKGFFTFDFGPSFVYQGRTVNQILKYSFPVTFLLGIEALTLALFGGFFLGSISALKKNKWQDHCAMGLSTLLFSFPNFVLATLFQYLFSIKLRLLPVAQWESFAHTILPAVTLAALPCAFIARLVKTNLMEVMQKEYIQTALSKGLNKRQILFNHALRNCLIPILSYLGPLTAYLFTGSFVIEKIFAIPGLGMWMIMSILSRDYTIIMGLAVFYSIVLLCMNFLVDILSIWVDPRIDLISKNELYEQQSI